jgi:AraC-like DNA-binding protein
VTKQRRSAGAKRVRLSPGTGILRHWANPATDIGLGRVLYACLYRAEGHEAPPPPLHTIPYYVLGYTVDGHGIYRDEEGRSIELLPGHVQLQVPGFAFWNGARADSHWTEFHIVFEGPVFDLWRAHGMLEPRHIHSHCEPIDIWLGRLEAIVGSPHQLGLETRLRAIIGLQDLLSRMLFRSSFDRGPADHRLVTRACALLEADLERRLTPSQVARQLGCSYEHLHKQFVRLVGMPPMKYRMTRLVQRACRLMAESSLTDKQIADRLGFGSAAYFSRRFHLMTGMSPRAYRRILPGN